MIFIGRLSRGLELEAGALRVSPQPTLASVSRPSSSSFSILEAPPSPPSERTFRRSTVVYDDATIVSQTTVLTTFMREISSLARQITPLRLSLNPSPGSLSPDILSTLIFSHPRYQAIFGRTKATVFNGTEQFYEPQMQNCRATYYMIYMKNAVI